LTILKSTLLRDTGKNAAGQKSRNGNNVSAKHYNNRNSHPKVCCAGRGRSAGLETLLESFWHRRRHLLSSFRETYIRLTKKAETSATCDVQQPETFYE